MDTSCSLISAVREGRLERVGELFSSLGLSYSQAEGYVLLCDAIENNHTAVTKLLLTSGSKVNSKNKKPSYTPLHFAVINGNIEIVEMLLDKGANIDAINQDGRTPLHNAIENEKMEVTELLLKHRADVNARDNGDQTPLHVAVMTGCLQIVEHLLKHGAYVNCACISAWGQAGYTPLHIAAEKGSEEIIKFLLSSNAHINASTKDNLTPLYIATKNGHTKVVKLLLDHGANVDAQDKDGKAILHLAVEKGYPVIIEHILNYCPDVNNKNNRSSLNAAVHGYGRQYSKIVENLLQYGFSVDPEDINNCKLLHAAVEKGYLKIVEDLLKYGTDVNMLYNFTSKTGYTPLHNATKNKQEKVATLLINYGADVNAKDEVGKTPIFYAIKNTDLKIVELLLQHDADINASDKYGRTALHFTSLREGEELFEFREDFDINIKGDEDPDIINIKGEIAKLLLSRGANVDAQDKDDITTLHAATKKGYAKVVEALLAYNANVNSVKNDITPLHLSAQEGNKVISTMLLNKGANVNAEQKDGITALHIATENGHKEIVEALLKCGAKVDSKDDRDITPLHIAAKKGYLGIFEILLKFGADIDSRDMCGRTALHIASKEGREEIVVTLLEYDSDINIVSKSNHTPLDVVMAGIRSFNNEVKFNADIDSRDKFGRTALHLGAEEGCLEVVKILLKFDADIDSRDEFGRTALHIAAEKGCLKIVEILLKFGADIDSRDKCGRTALHIASKEGREKIVVTLLEYNSDINIVSKSNHTPLDVAMAGIRSFYNEVNNYDPDDDYCYEGEGFFGFRTNEDTDNIKGEIAKLLLSRANVDAKDKKDMTPLHIAAQKGYLEIVYILLKFGADFDSRDKCDRTALHIASKKGHEEIVVALLEYGSDINIVNKSNHTPLDGVMAAIKSFYNLVNYYDSDDDYFDDDYCYDCKEVAKILQQQIIKMKTANLYVSRKNLLSISSNDGISDFQNECEEEMESMKSEKISNNNVSFHDILTKNVSQLAIYARNENIVQAVQVLKSDDYETEFPIYASMIKSRFRKGVERKELLEQGNRFFYLLFNRFPELPYDCTEKIFSYLSDKDLRFLIYVCEHVNILNTDISDVASTLIVKAGEYLDHLKGSKNVEEIVRATKTIPFEGLSREIRDAEQTRKTCET